MYIHVCVCTGIFVYMCVVYAHVGFEIYRLCGGVYLVVGMGLYAYMLVIPKVNIEKLPYFLLSFGSMSSH